MGADITGLTKFQFAGQEVYAGRMWYSQIYVDAVRIAPLTPYIPYMGGSNHYYFAFIDHGTPFDVITWFKNYYEGIENIPTVNTTIYFNDSGECTAADSPTWFFAIRYTGTKAYFSAGFMNDSDYTPDKIKQSQVLLGYAGCDLANITEEDNKFASLYFYTPTQEYLPDITNMDVGSSPRWPITNQVHAFMEGSLANSQNNTIPVLHTDIKISIAPYLQTYYCGDDTINFYGPNPTQTDWGYFVRLASGGNDWSPGLPSTLTNDLNTMNSDHAELGVGGDGDYNYPTMMMDFPEVPSVGIEDTGFTTMYIPTIPQLKSLSQYMWSSSFISSLEKLIAGDPIDAIINLSLLPVDLSSFRGTAVNCIIGNVDTGVQMYPLNTSYLELDLGSVNLKEVFEAILDYEPYSNIQLFLPFVGFTEIKPSEVLQLKTAGNNGQLKIQYNVNLFTGEFLAFVMAIKPGQRYQHIIAQYAGNLAYNISVSGKNYSNFYKNVLGAAVGVAAGGITGGSGIAAGAAITGAFTAATTEKPVQRSGNISGSSAIMGGIVPYIIRSMPKIQVDEDAYKALGGYPAYAYRQLNSMHGYTECMYMKLDGFTGTSEEAAELERLLKEGVFLP